MVDEQLALPNEDGPKGRFWRRRWVQWTGGAMAAALVALGVAVTMTMRHAEPMLKALIVEKLEQQFHARVELDSFHVSVAQGLQAEGKGLRIWPAVDRSKDEDLSLHPSEQKSLAGHPDSLGTPGDVKGAEVQGASGPGASGIDTPLITIAEFRFHAPLAYRPGVPIHISTVELDGLVVDVPPRPQAAQSGTKAGKEKGPHSEALPKPARIPGSFGVGHMESLAQFVVDTVECNDAHLTLETSKPGKLPLEFAIAQMELTHVSASGAMGYVAELTNPRPRGTITAKGSFGPWVVEDPGESAVQGSYTFENADLGTFKSIGGILNSTGAYKGALREMEVQGEADVPRFKLAEFGTELPLHTKFNARVDGTNGDTWLEPVEATLGQSHFTAEGRIVHEQASSGGADGAAHPAGHEIALNVNVDRGRVEDFLRLASKTNDALMTGAVKAKATLEIPPGMLPVMKRLKLKGNFALDEAQFTSAKIQRQIGELSLRGEGQTKEAKNGDDTDVRSAMQGDFEMGAGAITLPDLKYTVPGAEIDLAGKYGVEDGTLAFTGVARTQATISEMVGGWKGMLLKPVDRYFKKDGAGTEVPIHINGTRKDPEFGIDLNKMKTTSPQTPGATQ